VLQEQHTATETALQLKCDELVAANQLLKIVKGQVEDARLEIAAMTRHDSDVMEQYDRSPALCISPAASLMCQVHCVAHQLRPQRANVSRHVCAAPAPPRHNARVTLPARENA
jgi:hypothetical protein